MMRSVVFYIVILSVLFSLKTEASKVKESKESFILTSNEYLKHLVQKSLCGSAAVESLIKGDIHDSHFSPQDRKKMEEALLVLAISPKLEGGFPKSAKVTFLAKEGDTDFHVWLSPLKTIAILNKIEKKMVSLFPQRKDILGCTETYRKELESAHHKLLGELAPLSREKKTIFVYHNCLGAFAEEFKLSVFGLSDHHGHHGSTLKPKTLQNALQLAKKENIKTVFYESEAEKRIIEKALPSFVLKGPLKCDNLLDEEELKKEEISSKAAKDLIIETWFYNAKMLKAGLEDK